MLVTKSTQLLPSQTGTDVSFNKGTEIIIIKKKSNLLPTGKRLLKILLSMRQRADHDRFPSITVYFVKL